jgi:hypothetical protein
MPDDLPWQTPVPGAGSPEPGTQSHMSRSWTTAGLDDAAFRALAETLPASELWSLLMEVFAQRAAQRTPSALVQQWERDGFTRPAPVDQRTLLELDIHLLAAAARYEAVELSPLAPLGVCSRMAPASQHKIVSALRGTEVVSDPTNVLALECARRLRQNPRAVVRLATSHRCVRAQQVPNRPGFAQHFRIFCLATAGHEQKRHAMIVDGLVDHITTHLAALDRLERHGYEFPNRRVRVLARPDRSELGDRIAATISAPSVTRDVLDHPYYDGLRFMINVATESSDDIPLIDGGAFDWMGKLTANAKMVLVASGMGSQLAAYAFRRQATIRHT